MVSVRLPRLSIANTSSSVNTPARCSASASRSGLSRPKALYSEFCRWSKIIFSIFFELATYYLCSAIDLVEGGLEFGADEFGLILREVVVEGQGHGALAGRVGDGVIAFFAAELFDDERL